MAKSQGAFRTISEVATTLDTPTHVLRFWESKFSQIKPVKRAGGRRYYRPEDIQLLAGIKTLLHEQGMTIKGAQKLLREQGVKHVIGLAPDTQTPTETVKAEQPAVAVPAPVVDAPAPQEVAPIEPPAPAPIAAQPVTASVVPDSRENQPSAPTAAPRPRILAQLATTKPDRLRRNAAAIAPHLTQLAQLRDRIRRSQ